MAKLNMVKALNLALMQEMERDPDVLVIGEDVGVDGGVFRVTEDLHRLYGSKRVIDSPLAESAIIGTSIGMALYGLKPVCEIQFSGFAFQCFHQIENHAARYRNRSQGRFHVPMVMRMPYGGGVRALEHHSESEEQFYAHIPRARATPARSWRRRSATPIPSSSSSTRRSTTRTRKTCPTSPRRWSSAARSWCAKATI
jgi:pyruvate dehydrogenase E1 component beta subunit